ncbi:hypothetical protein [Rubeoparvulum massiliense]|uniref:hypothetical protein n=1 Tax=Rubeoparvulum massiliense TaxID=1631346 RepID=UPI00065E3207|nr:hypothetical protein [Rubeoparvulum massiliense]
MSPEQLEEQQHHLMDEVTASQGTLKHPLEKLLIIYLMSCLVLFCSFTIPQIIRHLPYVDNARTIPITQYLEGELSYQPSPSVQQQFSWVVVEQSQTDEYMVETFREMEQWIAPSGEILLEEATDHLIYLRYWLDDPRKTPVQLE